MCVTESDPGSEIFENWIAKTLAKIESENGYWPLVIVYVE